MKYSVRIEKQVAKELKKMDRYQSHKIVEWIKKNLVGCENPYIFGKPLKGNFSELWRYRIGAYRIIAEINNDTVTIIIVDIGHRKEVYEKLKAP